MIDWVGARGAKRRRRRRFRRGVGGGVGYGCVDVVIEFGGGGGV